MSGSSCLSEVAAAPTIVHSWGYIVTLGPSLYLTGISKTEVSSRSIGRSHCMLLFLAHTSPTVTSGYV